MKDRFVEDRLPPPELLPEFHFDLPEVQYSERLNAAVDALGRAQPIAGVHKSCAVASHGRSSYPPRRHS